MIPSCPTLTLIFTHTISLLLVSVLLIQLWKIWRRPATVAHLPPGSCGLPLIGETLSFLAANYSSRGFYDFVQARHLRYGNCFKTSIFGKTHVFVSSTGAAKAVLGNDFVVFNKRYFRSISELMGEQSLFCASVENHHRHLRHSLSGFFNMESLVSSVRMFDGLTVEAMSKWKPGETVVVYKDALKITFRTVCKMLMSLDREDELDEMQGDVFEITEAVLAFPLKLPGTRFFKGLKARERVMSKLREIIRLRREGLGCHEDFLQSLLMKAECSSDDSLTDSQIEDNILTLLISGHATSASAMTWMVKYLDENQEVQEKLRELHLRLACSSPKMSLGPEAFSEMPYGSKVVKEALRMSSVVSWFPRIALQDCEIDGFHIRRGWIVNVDARHIHYDPAVYKDPTKFYPSRFNEDPKPYSFLVYGTGERTCLGINLAKYMMLAFLHRLVTTFRWKVMDPDTSLVKQALVPRLRSGCPITVTPIKV